MGPLFPAHPTSLPGELSLPLGAPSMVAVGLEEAGSLRLTSPPAGHSDPCCISSLSPPLLPLLLLLLLLLQYFISKDPETPGRKHAQADGTVRCSRKDLLLLDAPNKFPLRKSPRGWELTL